MSEQKPSTARYHEALRERLQLLNEFQANTSLTGRFADGTWLIELATLEYELAYHVADDDLSLYFWRIAYGRGVHELVDEGLRQRAAYRQVEAEARAAIANTKVFGNKPWPNEAADMEQRRGVAS